MATQDSLEVAGGAVEMFVVNGPGAAVVSLPFDSFS